ncbi:MAG: pyridoxal 5'-phosphate synthase lyase subunit PdxS, partial [Candidatus Bipolaricaulota bacterium]|nr:pyridoxal 5'-phosphate synthase lyase subunit PdxS [Candidatus Bipolaricaulota bacterium]
LIARVSENLGEAMAGIEIATIPEHEKMQTRGR